MEEWKLKGEDCQSRLERWRGFQLRDENDGLRRIVCEGG